MSDTARVLSITPATMHELGVQTQVDVVLVEYAGGQYAWETPPGKYAQGQDVPVDRPNSALGLYITPSDSF